MNQNRHFKRQDFSFFLHNVIIYFLVFIGSVWLAGCAAESTSVQVKDGKEYGTVKGAFRHRWWNYYERGLSFAEGTFFKEAIADLNEAVRQRAEDQRMARTYGMHFVDYFPHRELGIVYYEMGDLAAAQKELSLSVSQFSTAKALFYLDRIRKKMIEEKGGSEAPPQLVLDLAKDEFRTREAPVIVSGTATDDHYIAGISIQGIPVFMESSQKTFAFKEELALAQGKHVIEIVARNLLGKTTKRDVTIHVDRQGPVITIENFSAAQKTPKEGITISGSVYDDSGIAELNINGRPVPVTEGVEILFDETVVSDKTELEVTARDRLGNQTVAQIPISRAFVMQQPVMLASAALDSDGRLLAGLFGPKDSQPPVVNLKGWQDTQTVFLDKVYLEGEASDENKIVGLTVNQVPMLRREGKSIFFGHLADLSEGNNSFLIEAADEAGNSTRKTISITRQIPQALQLEERLSMSILPFEEKGEISEASMVFQNNLIDALVDLNRFKIVERSKLDMVLQEQKLSQTQLIDRNTALRLGRLVAAQCILTGSIVETRTGIEIVARLIDTETSEILSTEDVYDEVKDLGALSKLSAGMAAKFHRSFPLLDGVVVHQKGKFIFTNLGTDKIRIQTRLVVYREEPFTDPKTGKVLGADNVILGHARVTQVMPDMSKAEVIKVEEGSIQRLDKVITE